MKFFMSEVNYIVLGTLQELNKAAEDVFDFEKLAGSPSTPPHGLSVKTFLTYLVETRNIPYNPRGDEDEEQISVKKRFCSNYSLDDACKTGLCRRGQ